MIVVDANFLVVLASGNVRNLLAPECELDYLYSRAQQLGIADLLNEVLKADE